jgi:hypothetical protein
MMPILVVPGSSLGRVEPLLAPAGWRGEPAPADGDDAEAALALARTVRPVLFVPREGEVATELRRILVIHGGGRGDQAGMDAADEAAVSSGAAVIVLHVPPSSPSTTAGSLPFRISDHGVHDSAEWQEEFLRRFCRCSEGVEVSLRVGAGSAAAIREQIVGERADLVIASSPGHELEPGTGGAIRSALDVAPLLIVPSVGDERPSRRRQPGGQSERSATKR